MWIKICANTNAEDVDLAVQLGASAVGFVFAPSPRRVSWAQARTLGASLPANVERIGVLDTQDPDEILRAAEAARLTGVQLHSPFDEALMSRLVPAFANHITLIQTVHWDLAQEASAALASIREQLRQIRQQPAITRILVDSRVGNVVGGTGVSFDWNAAAAAFARQHQPEQHQPEQHPPEQDQHLHWIVAGGLRPENVGQAISRLHPWGVDVASGVEASPGKKDPDKLKAFLKNASSSSLAQDVPPALP